MGYKLVLGCLLVTLFAGNVQKNKLESSHEKSNNFPMPNFWHKQSPSSMSSLVKKMKDALEKKSMAHRNESSPVQVESTTGQYKLKTRQSHHKKGVQQESKGGNQYKFGRLTAKRYHLTGTDRPTTRRYPTGTERPRTRRYPTGTFRPTARRYPTGTDRPTTRRYPTGTDRPTTRRYPTGTYRPITRRYPTGTDRPITRRYPTGTDRPTTRRYPTGTYRPTTRRYPTGTDRPTTRRYPTGTDRPTTRRYSTGTDRPTTRRYPTGTYRPTTRKYPTGTDRPITRTYHPTGRYPTSMRQNHLNTRHDPTTTGSHQPIHHTDQSTTTTTNTANLNTPTPRVIQEVDQEIFICVNGQVIVKTSACDGVMHCDDGSDENDTFCEEELHKPPCPAGMFPCDNKNCVFLPSVCDGLDTCGDNSDELEVLCDVNNATMILFECADGQVLKGEGILCDGVYDCLDKSDERDCDRNECVGIPCPTGRCILPEDLAYSAADCWGHNDPDPELLEMYCQGLNVFLCDNNTRCLNTLNKCDGVLDCMDSSDEMITKGNLQCECSLFPCNNGLCISKSDTCNGIDDCADGSDENAYDALCQNYNAMYCNQLSTEKVYCNNGLCVDQIFACNGVDDCGDNSDESEAVCKPNPRDCPQFSCSNMECINHKLVCNNFDDCGDNSDETSCPTSSPIWGIGDSTMVYVVTLIIVSLLLLIIAGVLYQLKKTKHYHHSRITSNANDAPPAYHEVVSNGNLGLGLNTMTKQPTVTSHEQAVNQGEGHVNQACEERTDQNNV